MLGAQMRCALAPLFIMQIIHPFMPLCETTINPKPYVPGMAEAMGWQPLLLHCQPQPAGACLGTDEQVK